MNRLADVCAKFARHMMQTGAVLLVLLLAAGQVQGAETITGRASVIDVNPAAG